MKTVVLYKPESEHATIVDTFARDFKMQTGKDVALMDAESVEGSELCKLYDIVDYPAIIATDEEGKIQNSWIGLPLPLISELSYYVGDHIDA